MNNDEAINIIRTTCESVFPDCRVLLFGSRARSDYSEDSDFDFLIVTKKTFDVKQKRSYKSLLRKRLATYKIPADILIQSQKEIDIKERITGHIIREIIKEGVTI